MYIKSLPKFGSKTSESCIYTCITMEILQSEKGKPMYIDGNYIFWSDSFSKLDDQLLFWRCSKRSNGCKAISHTNNGAVVKRINDYLQLKDNFNVHRVRVVEQQLPKLWHLFMTMKNIGEQK